MKDADFQELVASVREAGSIMRGETTPSRQFQVEVPTPDVRGIRDKFQLSQPDFAAMLGISVATLRNWEQGRRSPEGPARILLSVAEHHPEAVWDVVKTSRPAKKMSLRRPALAVAKAAKS